MRLCDIYAGKSRVLIMCDIHLENPGVGNSVMCDIHLEKPKVLIMCDIHFGNHGVKVLYENI